MLRLFGLPHVATCGVDCNYCCTPISYKQANFASKTHLQSRLVDVVRNQGARVLHEIGDVRRFATGCGTHVEDSLFRLYNNILKVAQVSRQGLSLDAKTRTSVYRFLARHRALA